MKKLFLILLVLVAVSTPIFSQTVDARLNGTWVGVMDGLDIEFTFRNGNFESMSDGVLNGRGTYTVNNSELTFRPSHIFGGSLNAEVATSAEIPKL